MLSDNEVLGVVVQFFSVRTRVRINLVSVSAAPDAGDISISALVSSITPIGRIEYPKYQMPPLQAFSRTDPGTTIPTEDTSAIL